ncbi:hypothetical protein RCL_jg3491.t1 [Rhizophagus clarus]|uniref:Uncharacterized protein n=1 Tax=Rhizophagus clarus TaxID=94130 RepID=A0A8H3QZA9_9GLOM|nr:hypothetical protein RCL_jg3491.t1 [Rhizophagus clarus]
MQGSRYNVQANFLTKQKGLIKDRIDNADVDHSKWNLKYIANIIVLSLQVNSKKRKLLCSYNKQYYNNLYGKTSSHQSGIDILNYNKRQESDTSVQSKDRDRDEISSERLIAHSRHRNPVRFLTFLSMKLIGEIIVWLLKRGNK